MSIAERIYKASPLFLQNVMVSLYGWRWQKRRFGGVFQEQLNQFKSREFYTALQWSEYSSNELQKVLCFAFENVPYYKNKWELSGLTKDSIQRITIDSLGSLPFLEKNDLRKYCKSALLSSGIRGKKTFFASSGTTGTPVSILYSKTMHQLWSAAYEARVRHWAGVNRFMSRGMIGGRRVVPEGNATIPYYRYNTFENQIYFSAYHISPSTAANYLDAMRKYRPEYMAGYAMSNYLLARYIYEQKLKAPKLKAVITSSEQLTQQMRDTFEKVYGCKTYDGWSGVEACGLVSECEYGKLHINPDVGLIEILDKQGMPVSPGETGEVVCTGFLNYEQPLIRYKIGDYMTLALNQSCSCKREMPIIENIIGRIEDVIIGKDGREMVRFHGIFIGLDKIIQAQVIQEEIDTIHLNIVSETPLTNEEQEILTKRIYSQLGDVNVQIFQLKEIPCGANGKHKAVISKVKRENL